MSRAAYIKEWRKRNPEKQKEYVRKSRLKHLEKRRQEDRDYSKNNREKKTKAFREWRHKNPDKVRASNQRYYEKQREWLKNHPELTVFHARVRRGMQRQAKPSWVDAEHLDKIRQFYFSAKTQSEFHEEPFHVDHIEPLKGVNTQGEHISCGLHVWWNLQVLPAEENIKKSNKVNQQHHY